MHGIRRVRQDSLELETAAVAGSGLQTPSGECLCLHILAGTLGRRQIAFSAHAVVATLHLVILAWR